MMNDTSGRPGHDPLEMQSIAEADQKVRNAQNRHPGMEESAADGRSLRSRLPLLAILVAVFLVLLVLSLPR